MSTFQEVENKIDAQLKREDLSAEDVLLLTLAHRLNRCSEVTLAKALGGGTDAPTKSGLLARMGLRP